MRIKEEEEVVWSCYEHAGEGDGVAGFEWGNSLNCTCSHGWTGGNSNAALLAGHSQRPRMHPSFAAWGQKRGT